MRWYKDMTKQQKHDFKKVMENQMWTKTEKPFPAQITNVYSIRIVE